MSSTNNIENIPVAIVGGGPVGLTVALELGRRGIRSILLEQAAASNEFPRMLFVNYRSMQHCRRWGIVDQVRGRTVYPPDYPMDIAFITGLDGYEITRFEYPGHAAAEVPPEVPELSQICPQNIFDPLMRETAASNPNTDIRFSHRVERFDQDEDGVTVEVMDLDAGEKKTIRAAYMLACDGAASGIRNKLGIDMVGNFLDYNISVLFRAPEILKKTLIAPARHFHMIGDNGFDFILNSVDGGTTWRVGFSGMADEPDLATFDVEGRIRRKLGIDVDLEIVKALPWTRSTKTAERYREGRVFLVGDAAHTWSPTGGFGMNTGLNDAVDLAWKLEGVFRGWGGEHLLDSYDLERRPACEGILAEAQQNYVNLRIKADFDKVAADDDAGAEARADLAEKVQATVRREYETIGVQMGYHYDGSPIIVPDGTEPASPRYDTYIPSARPGHIAPHAWIHAGRSTMDLFGEGFALLHFDGSETNALDKAAHTAGLPLAVHMIDNAAIADLYESNLVLVRPDGHVAWRGDEAPDNPAAIIDVVRGVQAWSARRAAAE